MVRLAFLVVVLVGAGFSALALSPDRMPSGDVFQNAPTTLSLQGEMIEASTLSAPQPGLVCKAPAEDDDSHACTGKTLVGASLPYLPQGVGVSPREIPTPLRTSGTLIPTDLQPPKAA